MDHDEYTRREPKYPKQQVCDLCIQQNNLKKKCAYPCCISCIFFNQCTGDGKDTPIQDTGCKPDLVWRPIKLQNHH